MNIIWRKPDSSLAVTSVSDINDLPAYVEQLKNMAVIPADWVAIAFNATIPASEPPENWLFDNGVITVNPNKSVVIPTITMRQARLGLLANNLLDLVESVITQPNDRVWWEYSTTVERNNPLVIQVLTALGKSYTEIDTLFIQAALL